MWVKVFVLNVLILCLLATIGYLPARWVERKTGSFRLETRAFVSLILGYFLVETFIGIGFTKGNTVQWFNLLPFFILVFLPDAMAKNQWKAAPVKALAGPLVAFLFAIFYFAKSYSTDLQTIDRYPFIDIVSYASTAFGMALSGAETVFFDTAIFYPERVGFGLYHFTELWFTAGLTKLLGITELYAISLLVPVFFAGLVAFGLNALGADFEMPWWTKTCLITALCFANAKLLIHEDLFFYNMLDLCGLKISLIIPLFAFLYLLKDRPLVLIAFSFWLPQVNILLVFAWAIGLALYSMQNIRQLKTAFAPVHWVAFGVFALGMVLLLVLNPLSSAGPAGDQFTLGKAVSSSFTYFREAVFNLGINYWAPFVVVSAMVVSARNILLLVPFTVAKASSWLLGHSPFRLGQEFAAVPEILIFFSVLLVINLFVKIYSPRVLLGFLILFCLSCIGGVGLAATGFMDFEQIYTLYACALFFLFAFFLFKPSERTRGILHYMEVGRYKWLIAGILLIVITYRTFRWQRTLPFDAAFYSQISQVLAASGSPAYAAYFSTKPYYPFPLHIQAGFPLLFQHGTAISTPITMLEDSSWKHTERVGHVEALPFSVFSREDSVFQKDKNLGTLQTRFIQQNRLGFAWVDANYPQSRRKYIQPAVKQRFVSQKEGLEFWVIDLRKLPAN